MSVEPEMSYPTPTLKGRVDIPEEAGISASDVIVQVEGVDKEYHVTSDGNWCISGLEEGKSYDVYFHSTQIPASQKDSDDDDDEDDYWADKIEDAIARSGKDLYNYIANLTRAWTVKGQVTLTDKSDHSGIMAYIPGTSYIAMTDSLGNFTIKGVPEGENYIVSFAKNEWITVSTPKFNLKTKTGIKRVKVLDAAVLTNEFGSITGMLTFENPSITSAANWSVFASDDASFITPKYPVLSDGRYTLAHLKAGTYTIWFADNMGNSFSVSNVVVTEGAVSNIDHMIPDLTSRMTGTIKADGAADYTDAVILLVSGSDKYQCSPDKDGNFSIAAKPGTFTWTIILNGYESATGSVVLGAGAKNIGEVVLKKLEYQNSIVVDGRTKLVLEADVLIPWYIEISITGDGAPSTLFSINWRTKGFKPRYVDYNGPVTLTASINDEFKDYFIRFSSEKVIEGRSEYTLVRCTLDRNFKTAPAFINLIFTHKFEIADGDYMGMWLDRRDFVGSHADSKGLIPVYNDRKSRTIKVEPGRYAMNGTNQSGPYPSVWPVDHHRNEFAVSVDTPMNLEIAEGEGLISVSVPGYTGTNGIISYLPRSGQSFSPRGGGVRIKNGVIEEYAEFGRYDITFYPEDDPDKVYKGSCDVKNADGCSVSLVGETIPAELRMKAEGKYYEPGDDIKFSASTVGMSNPVYTWSLDGVEDTEQTGNSFDVLNNSLSKGGHRISLKVTDGSTVREDHRDIVISPEKVQRLNGNGFTYFHYRQDVPAMHGVDIKLNPLNMKFGLLGHDYEQRGETRSEISASIEDPRNLGYSYYLVGYTIGEENHVDVVLDKDIASPAYLKIAACNMYNPNDDGHRGIWLADYHYSVSYEDCLGIPVMNNYDTRTFKVEPGKYYSYGNYSWDDQFVQYKIPDVSVLSGDVIQQTIVIEYH